MTLGNLYASIETACRALRDKAAMVQQQNISVLTDLQKSKLNTLNDAMKLIPTISEAQSGNLLGASSSPQFYFTAVSLGTATFSSTSFSGPGCGVNGAFGVIGGVIGGFLPPLPSPPQPGVVELSTTPAPANRTVNKLSGDFGPGNLPQTKTQ
jgi:hypothetical protein